MMKQYQRPEVRGDIVQDSGGAAADESSGPAAAQADQARQDLYQRVTAQIVELLLPSADVIQRPIRHVVPWIGVALLLVAVALAAPPIKTEVLSHRVSVNEIRWLSANKQQILGWVEFSRTLLEVTIGLAISTQAFTGTLKQQFESTIKVYEQTRHKILDGDVDELRSELKGNAQRLRELLTPARRGFIGQSKAFAAAAWLSYGFYRALMHRVPRIYQRMLLLSFVSSAPGGLYGFVAYAAFILLVVAKLAKLYLDGVK